MKKLSYLFIAIISFVGVSYVKADSTEIYISDFYNPYSFYNDISSNNSSIINNLISYYNSNWSSTYSDYIVRGSSYYNYIELIPGNNSDFIGWYDTNGHRWLCYYGLNSINDVYTSYRYDFDNSSYSVVSDLFTCSSDMPYSSLNMPYFKETTSGIRPVSSISLPSYSNLDLDVSYEQQTLQDNDIIPTYVSLTNGDLVAGFTEVDMSDYEYIILSLKNYDTTTFNTTIYSLGRLCFTPVYNYGMTPKQDYVNGYQTQSCTEYYNTSTPVPIYIIQVDLDNHAVYYIKRYESETNILQIPTSIFDITYITSQNANNPQVIIDGRSYPAIPYSDLTDTANISTDEGYISGQVCTLGDINCQTNQSGMDISDLFTQPLKVLQSVWTSITSVFILIEEFIALIPSPLKEFLISAFMLSIILGILKIIL